jgi:hypothetical protein
MYSKFKGILLRYYEASFPVYYTNYKSNHNNWVTKGIKTSRIKKTELYSLYRNNKDNVQLRNYYKKYCNILNRVINEAKIQTFHNQIATSSNKVKAAWNIIKNNSGNSQTYEIITKINCGHKLLNNPKDTANAFNKFYTLIVTNSNIKHSDTY